MLQTKNVRNYIMQQKKVWWFYFYFSKKKGICLPLFSKIINTPEMGLEVLDYKEILKLCRRHFFSQRALFKKKTCAIECCTFWYFRLWRSLSAWVLTVMFKVRGYPHFWSFTQNNTFNFPCGHTMYIKSSSSSWFRNSYYISNVVLCNYIWLSLSPSFSLFI